MNNKLLILLVVPALLALLAFGQKSSDSAQNMTAQRYQLMTAHLEREGNVIFLIDTKEGRVWEYQSAARIEGGKSIPESFFPIGIGLPMDGIPGWGLKSAAIEDTGVR